jgi:chromosome segregation protein
VQAAGADVTEARRGLSDAEQALRLAEADKGHAQRALENLAQRRSRLEQDRQALGAPDAGPAGRSRRKRARPPRPRWRWRRRAWRRCRPPYPRPRRSCAPPAKRLQAAHRSLTETRARHDALAQLQAKVAQSGEIGEWLKARGLAEAKPLWQAIQVDAGWETAVEAVLRERFSALAADADTVRAALASPPPSILTLALAGQRRGNFRSCRQPARQGALRRRALVRRTRRMAGRRMPSPTISPPNCRWPGGQRVSRAGHLLTPGRPHAVRAGCQDPRRDRTPARDRRTGRRARSRHRRGSAAREVQRTAEQSLADAQGQLGAARRSPCRRRSRPSMRHRWRR